jgi:hypothetical protein
MKEIEMSQRDKWIIIVCVACAIAPATYFGYFAVWAMRDLNRMEARRPLLLYETDHRVLLEACREISRQVAAGKLEPGSYQIHGDPDPDTRQFPQLILDLDPLHVYVDKDGQVDVIMSPVVMYGVYAFPEHYEGSIGELKKYSDQVWGIELIDGLRYYDEDFQKHPEHKKEVEELLKKRKAGDSSGVPYAPGAPKEVCAGLRRIKGAKVSADN